MEGEARRDQIAQAVLALASEQGAGAVSIAAVAHRIGVAPSALYRHYPSKDAMIGATLEGLTRRMLGNVERARAAASDPLGALERLLQLQVELIRGNRGLPFVVFSEGATRAGGHRERFLGFVMRFRTRIAALIREAQEAGQVRADIPAENLAISYVGLYVPSAILWNLSAGRFDIRSQARRGWTVFRDGIRTPAVRATRPVRGTRAARALERRA